MRRGKREKANSLAALLFKYRGFGFGLEIGTKNMDLTLASPKPCMTTNVDHVVCPTLSRVEDVEESDSILIVFFCSILSSFKMWSIILSRRQDRFYKAMNKAKPDVFGGPCQAKTLFTIDGTRLNLMSLVLYITSQCHRVSFRLVMGDIIFFST